ncbi:MAG TPA: CHAD domain-containing protein [Gemmatimonadaceae bacterium]|nr:CHAD domain-containing protein [Gemmatimonadaceae bacterium]
MPQRDDRIRLTPALLGMPAQHSTRVVASGLLDELLAAQDRFAAEDAEGLHDLRVAMRRLRSWMRAFRPELSDTVRGRTRRRLHALASATNEARDTEVVLDFLDRQTNLPARSRATARALAERLGNARDAHVRALRRTLARDLTKVTRGLAMQLESWWERHAVDEPRPVPSTSAVLADAIHRHLRRVDRALARIEPPGKADDLHRARIAVKRLRYLLEPLDESLGAAEPIRQLQALQGELGDARDAHRIAMQLVREVGEHSARSARRRALTSVGVAGDDDAAPPETAVTRAGLTELARRAHAARETALSEFTTRWREAEIAALVEQVRAVAARLVAG